MDYASPILFVIRSASAREEPFIFGPQPRFRWLPEVTQSVGYASWGSGIPKGRQKMNTREQRTPGSQVR
jgi:hypothetical protein